MDYHSSRNRKGQTGLHYGDSHPATYNTKTSPSKSKKHEKYSSFTLILLVQMIAAATILSVFTVIRLISSDFYKDISVGMNGSAFVGEDVGQAAQDAIQYMQDSETFAQLFPSYSDSAQGDSAQWTSVFLTDSAVNAGISEACVCPIDYAEITSYFGQRDDPFSQAQAIHNGWDMAADEGTTVFAAWSGTVIDCAYEEIGGNYIVIDHGNQIRTYYGHLSDMLVQKGQAVSAGQNIGLSGNTGKTTGPHLHFEIAQNGEPVDPALFLNA